VKALVGTIEKVATEDPPKTIVVAGGVASNAALRESAQSLGAKLKVPVYFPSRHLSTDNAAMIAAAGYFHLQNGIRSDLHMTADIGMRLQNLDNEDADLKKAKVRYRL
jgi:N6-L-threonylcarbamoyladenine synthase